MNGIAQSHLNSANRLAENFDGTDNGFVATADWKHKEA